MVTSISVNSCIGQWLAGALIFLAAPMAFAGPGFIQHSRVSGAVSGDESVADVTIRFNCKAQYLRHEPPNGGDHLRIYLDPTGICNGVPPTVAESRSRHRPFNAESANLVDLVYDGNAGGDPVLTLNFSKPVEYDVETSPVSFGLVVHIRPSTAQPAPIEDARLAPTVKHRQVVRPKEETPDFVINLASFSRVPTAADGAGLQLSDDQRL
ncbi:MAG: hypothetical protein GY949_04265, partial [Gammaproteobacteria bacterium]|nr:hypothetical protein [Gammaproteobacteria bacterium]